MALLVRCYLSRRVKNYYSIMSRTILLPKDCSQNYDIVDLPDYQDIKSSRKYLKTGDQLFELKSFQQDPRSIIFENSDQGRISESSEVIMATKFNVIFLLISALYNNKGPYITLENIIDNHEWVNSIPETLVTNALNCICDVLNENGESFYKINQEKAQEWLKHKIQMTKEHLMDSKLMTQIKLNLYVDSESEIPPGFLESEVLSVSNDMILSYLCIDIKLYDFEELSQYKKNIQSRLVAKTMAVEANKPKTEKPSKVTKTIKKRTTVKVAKGKGALDMFFK